MNNIKDKKFIQLELPFTFNNDRKDNNLIPFPEKLVLEKNRIEKEAVRRDAISKGIEKYAKTLNWYYK